MNLAYLLIGGNMGDRPAFLALAKHSIEKKCGSVKKQSAVYETAAWGLGDQAAFLNQVLQVETALSPLNLLHCVLEIEKSIGRERAVKYGPRIIDIDILLFNDEIIRAENLSVPHPQMQLRRFVLEPLAEIAPDLLHPVLKKTVTELLADCPDKLDVHKI